MPPTQSENMGKYSDLIGTIYFLLVVTLESQLWTLHQLHWSVWMCLPESGLKHASVFL